MPRLALLTGCLLLAAACEPQPRIEIHPTTAAARDRPYPVLLPVPLVYAAGGPPRLLPQDIQAVEDRAEALLTAPPPSGADTAADLARAAALRQEAAALRGETPDGAVQSDDLRARAEALRQRTEDCADPDALPPCPAPGS